MVEDTLCENKANPLSPSLSEKDETGVWTQGLWFLSYVFGRKYYISICQVISDAIGLIFGVPTGLNVWNHLP